MNNKFHLIRSIKTKPDTTRKQHLRMAIYLTLGLFLTLMIFTARTLIVEREVRSKELLLQKIKFVEDKFINYTELIENNTNLFKKWGNSGVIDISGKLTKIDSKIIPIIEEHPFLISVCIAGSDSSYYMLKRLDNLRQDIITNDRNDWQSFQTGKDSLGFWLNYTNSDSTLIIEDNILEMIHNGLLFKSFAKTDIELNESKLDVAKPITDERATSSVQISYQFNNIDYYALFNFDIRQVEEDIQNLSISESGQVYLLPHNQIDEIGIDNDNLEIDSSQIQYLSQREKILEKAINNWLNRSEIPFTFWNNNIIWHGLAKLRGNDNFSRWLMVVLPENELFNELAHKRNTIYFFIFIILVFGSSIFVILVRLYNRALPDQYISSEQNEQNQLLHLIRQGESDELEFKSTLRWNLKSNKPDTNIQISVLKTLVAYMNSEGGKLLIGVQDDGSILGIQVDQFPNDDKFMLHLNNMIKQHIGLEFSQWINYKIIQENEKKVLLVECEKSREPAFLKIDDNEDFYIRIGPASRKLSTKKALHYLLNQDKGIQNNA